MSGGLHNFYHIVTVGSKRGKIIISMFSFIVSASGNDAYDRKPNCSITPFT